MGNPQQSWQGWESLRKEVALDVSLGHGSSPTPQGKSGLGHGQWEQGLLQLFQLKSLGLSTSGLSLPPAPPGITILSSIASVHVGRKTTRVFFFHCKHLLLILPLCQRPESPPSQDGEPWHLDACARGQLCLSAVDQAVGMQLG